MKWARVRSWHAVRTFLLGGSVETYCGRVIASPAPIAEDLPAEKSCETCLRIIARAADSG